MITGIAALLTMLFGGLVVHDTASRKEWIGAGVSSCLTVAVIAVLFNA
ncbi:hypothetical protein [Cohnella kolymensis]|nr:hypothetical protein [Cohnella kolymensis]